MQVAQEPLETPLGEPGGAHPWSRADIQVDHPVPFVGQPESQEPLDVDRGGTVGEPELVAGEGAEARTRRWPHRTSQAMVHSTNHGAGGCGSGPASRGRLRRRGRGGRGAGRSQGSCRCSVPALDSTAAGLEAALSAAVMVTVCSAGHVTGPGGGVDVEVVDGEGIIGVGHRTDRPGLIVVV